MIEEIEYARIIILISVQPDKGFSNEVGRHNHWQQLKNKYPLIFILSRIWSKSIHSD